MGLYYPSQEKFVLIGSKSGTTITSVTLESTYQTTTTYKIINTGGYSKANFSILYTTGSAETSNSIEVRLRTSVDGTNFYPIVNESVSGGTSTLTAREFTFAGASAATPYTFSLPIDLQDKYMDVAVKETGVAANKGTVFVEAVLSGN